jgi:peptide/nickel transport system substrate-binding protein
MVFLRRARASARGFGWAAMVSAAALAAGCGSSGGGSGGAGSTGHGKALTKAANSGGSGCKSVKRGGTLNFGVDQDVISFDAHDTQDNGSLWADMNIYDQLVELAPDAKKVVPGLAQSWTTSNGGRVYTFHLRPDAKFSDGTPVTADDVKFSFDRVEAPKSVNNWTLSAIKSTDIVDPHTIKVTLSKPYAPFLNDLTLWGASIMSKKAVEGGQEPKTHPMGSGPFSVAEFKPGDHVLLKANPYYWGKDSCGNKYPYVSAVRLAYVPNDNTRMTELRGGQLDAVMDVPYNQIGAIDKDPNLVAAATPQLGIIASALNMTDVAEFRDPNVVKAMNHAIDRQAIVKGVFFGNAKPATSPIDPGVYFHTDKYGYPYDLAKAKQLMAKSKYPKGFTVSFSPPAGDQLAASIATIMQSELKQIGIKMKIEPVDQTTAFERLQKQQFQMSYTYGTSDNLEPNSNMLFCCVSDGDAKSGYTGWVDKSADALYHQTQGELDVAKRGQLFDQWQKIIMDKLPILWLINPTNRFAFANDVHDFFIQSTAHYPLWVAWKG